MSFLAGRLAGKEAAYFFQESKQAVGKLVQKNPNANKSLEAVTSSSAEHEGQHHADVLPEVLRHSLPSKVFRDDTVSSSFNPSKWVLPSQSKAASSVSPDVLNPLRAYLSLPQVTFGPKRWELPEMSHSVSASTANELHRDRHTTPINPEKIKAAAEGLANVGKAFAVATALVFGGATLVFGMVASKLDLKNLDDIKTRGKDAVEPKFENIRELLDPLKIWAENLNKKWHLERETDLKQKPIIKELSKMFGAKTSD
ncbi:uncharacterized protein LOC129300696 [Prosopis cineraria]|uniref:uncharacterized protein LOC129300696 n=1 Tax=Prosopis cineraria TaxID=364024 RepID=UPI00241037DA|nr:uncharacterized protein LOC129300696 [Prosopis cineraria]